MDQKRNYMNQVGFISPQNSISARILITIQDNNYEPEYQKIKSEISL